jgi:hypothetical protein
VQSNRLWFQNKGTQHTRNQAYITNQKNTAEFDFAGTLYCKRSHSFHKSSKHSDHEIRSVEIFADLIPLHEKKVSNILLCYLEDYQKSSTLSQCCGSLNVYPGSLILIFNYPGSRILHPGSNNCNKRGGKKFVVLPTL